MKKKDNSSNIERMIIIPKIKTKIMMIMTVIKNEKNANNCDVLPPDVRDSTAEGAAV